MCWPALLFFFFFNDTATTEIYTLSLHDALPIFGGQNQGFNSLQVDGGVNADLYLGRTPGGASPSGALPEVLPHAISLERSEEHTSELQSRLHLVCRLLLEKKKHPAPLCNLHNGC